MLLYISMKFHENILKAFQVVEQTWNDQSNFKGEYLQNFRRELRFLCCARRLMMLYVSMKFHETILNGFQDTNLRIYPNSYLYKFDSLGKYGGVAVTGYLG